MCKSGHACCPAAADSCRGGSEGVFSKRMIHGAAFHVSHMCCQVSAHHYRSVDGCNSILVYPRLALFSGAAHCRFLPK